VGVGPAHLAEGLRVAVLGQVEQRALLHRLRSLGQQLPVKGDTGGLAVHSAEVGEQEQPGFGSSAERGADPLCERADRGDLPSRGRVELRSVGRAYFGQAADMDFRPTRDVPRDIEDFVVGAVPVGQGEQVAGQAGLGAVQLAQD
jgi:hypothetical protein